MSSANAVIGEHIRLSETATGVPTADWQKGKQLPSDCCYAVESCSLSCILLAVTHPQSVCRHASTARDGWLVETVPLDAKVELRPGQSQTPRGLRLVPTAFAERAGDRFPLDRSQVGQTAE